MSVERQATVNVHHWRCRRSELDFNRFDRFQNVLRTIIRDPPAQLESAPQARPGEEEALPGDTPERSAALCLDAGELVPALEPCVLPIVDIALLHVPFTRMLLLP